MSVAKYNASGLFDLAIRISLCLPQGKRRAEQSAMNVFCRLKQRRLRVRKWAEMVDNL